VSVSGEKRYVMTTHDLDGRSAPWTCPRLLTEREVELLLMVQERGESREWLFTELDDSLFVKRPDGD